MNLGILRVERRIPQAPDLTTDPKGHAMKRFFISVVLFAVTLPIAQHTYSQTNDCPVEINGSRRGEPGNIQDNMFHSLAIDPTNENVVYAGTEANGIFKTTDGGTRWMRLRRGLKCTAQHNSYSQIFDIAIDPANAQTLYASAVNGPGPPAPVTYPSASAGVYKSTDGGLTWTQYTSGFTNTYTCYVLVDSTNPNRLYAGIGGVRSTFPPTLGQFFDGGLWLSTNGGTSWSSLSLPTGVNTNVPMNLVILGANQQTIYASWQLHRNDSTTAYGLTKSTDAGQTWGFINPPGRLVYSFDVAKQDPNLIYANDTTAQRRVHRSTDGGATWTAIPTAGFFGEIRIHPTNSQIIFYTGFTSIMRSTNGLVSATAVYTDTGLTTGQQIMDIKISQSNPNVVWACAKGYYLYRSTNGGDTFTRLTAIRDSVYNNPVSVEEDGSTRSPLSFALLPNWPNPFNPTTRIRFSIPDVEARLTVSLRVFDVLGREVATLVNEIKLPGECSAQWNAEGFASGIYFYKLQAGAFIATKKMLLVR